MRIEGRLIPPAETKSKYWAVEIPIIGVFTQGTSKKNALEMAADAVAVLWNRSVENVQIIPFSEGSFHVASEEKDFLPFLLSRIRQNRKMTLSQVARAGGSKSVNAFARYEQAKGSVPTVRKLEELLGSLDPDLHVVICRREEKKRA